MINKGIKIGDQVHLANWNDLATIVRLVSYEVAVSLQKQEYTNIAIFVGSRNSKYFVANSDIIQNRCYILPESIL